MDFVYYRYEIKITPLKYHIYCGNPQKQFFAFCKKIVKVGGNFLSGHKKWTLLVDAARMHLIGLFF